jgi:hypothetical protein
VQVLEKLGRRLRDAGNWRTTCSHKRFSEIISAYNRVFSFDAFYTMRGGSVFIEFDRLIECTGILTHHPTNQCRLWREPLGSTRNKPVDQSQFQGIFFRYIFERLGKRTHNDVTLTGDSLVLKVHRELAGIAHSFHYLNVPLSPMRFPRIFQHSTIYPSPFCRRHTDTVRVLQVKVYLWSHRPTN